MRRLLPWLPALGVALLLVGTVLYGMAGRLTYPYDLEWMEGGQLAHAWRVLNDLPLYPPPGPEWVPYIYPPGHADLLASLAGIFGLTPTLGRAVSWVGTGLACASIALVVVRQCPGPNRGIGAALGVACYLACWMPSGAFLDLVRPDALAVGLLLAALAASLEREPAVQLAGGLLLALAFWCKHPLAVFGLPLTLGLWARDGHPWGALRVGLAALAPAVVLTAVQQALEPDFLTYLLAVPASHGVVARRMLPLTPWELGAAFPVGLALIPAAALWRWTSGWAPRVRAGVRGGLVGLAVVVGGLGLLWPVEGGAVPWWGVIAGGGGLTLGGGVVGIGLWRTIRGEAVGSGAWLGIGLGCTALLLAAWMRGHVGGFVNVHLPLFAVTALGVGWAVSTCERPLLSGVVSVGLAAQLALAWWTLPLAHLVPTPEMVQAGDRVVATLRSRPGRVWSPVAPFLAVQAGHAPGPHLIAVWDTANHPRGPWPDTRGNFQRAVRAHYWEVIVQGERPVRLGIEAHYVLEERLRLPRRFRPRTGWGNRPESVWVPGPGRGGR